LSNKSISEEFFPSALKINKSGRKQKALSLSFANSINRKFYFYLQVKVFLKIQITGGFHIINLLEKVLQKET